MPSLDEWFDTQRRNCHSKDRFFTFKEAEDAAHFRKMQFTTNLRPYYCEWCRGWHLTRI